MSQTGIQRRLTINFNNASAKEDNFNKIKILCITYNQAYEAILLYKGKEYKGKKDSVIELDDDTIQIVIIDSTKVTIHSKNKNTMQVFYSLDNEEVAE